MNIVWFFVSLTVTFLALLVSLPSCVELYHRYRRSHFVVCPENEQQGSVVVSAGLAAASSALMPIQLHIKDCTLWPEHKHCGRRCLRQIRSLPA
jgi:hypothetical protein